MVKSSQSRPTIAHLCSQITPSPSVALMDAMNFYLNLPNPRIVSSTNNPIGVSLLVGQALERSDNPASEHS